MVLIYFIFSTLIKRCANCGFTYYCSKPCQIRDWRAFHKQECKYMKQLKVNNSKIVSDDQGMFVFRFVLKSHLDAEFMARKWQMYDGSQRCVDDLMDHVQEMREQTPDRFARMCLLSREIIDLGIDGLTLDTVLKRFSQVKTNALTIANELSVDDILHYPASGLYVDLAVFDHSCRPNATRTCLGRTMTVRAVKDIDTDKDKICITYIDSHRTRAERQARLKQLYFFDCQCELCMDTDGDHYIAEINHIRTKITSSYVLAPGLQTELSKNMRDMITKVEGEYSVSKIDLLRIELELAVRENARRPSPSNISMWKELKSQMKVIYGIDHPFSRYCLQLGATIGLDRYSRH